MNKIMPRVLLLCCVALVAFEAHAVNPMVAAGTNHSLALKSDGTVWAWGSNQYGQLGYSTPASGNYPGQVLGLTGVVAVAAGSYHSLALKADGSVWAWGDNSYGQLGDGTTTYRSTPVQVPALTGVVSVAGGFEYTVALKTDGSVWTWGLNDIGQLGNGTTTNRSTPAQVTGLTGVVAVAVGTDHTLAVKSDGSVWAWGSNTTGQLGIGFTSDYDYGSHPSPAQVLGLTGVVSVAAGGDNGFSGAHSLAIKADGSIWSWGSNASGQLGNGTTPTFGSHPAPAQVLGLIGIVAVVGGPGQSIALKCDGSVWAWGLTDLEPYPFGTWMRSTWQVTGLTGVVSVAAGTYHTVVVKSDGSVWAWGRGDYGQLGDGSMVERTSPVRVAQVFGVGPAGTTMGFLNLGSVVSANCSPVYRFVNVNTGGHFFTISETEKDDVLKNKTWFKSEGVGFNAYPTQQLGTLPVYRFFNTPGQGYFYTIYESEKDYVVQNLPAFTYEGVAFYAYPSVQPGTLPIYRFQNTRASAHFFTIYANEKDTVIQNYNWFIFEGISFYTYPRSD